MVSQPVDDGFRVNGPNNGQSFTAIATTSIGRISVRPHLAFDGILHIYDGNAGSGTVGAVVGPKSPVYSQPLVKLTASASGDPMQDIVLSTPFPVIAGSQYTFILEGSPSHFFLSQGNPYAGGQLIVNFADSRTGFDLAFQIWAAVPAAPTSTASIPVLTPWGLGLLSLLVGGFALRKSPMWARVVRLRAGVRGR